MKTNNRSDHLFDEFATYYAAERCRWAPENPRRVYNLAFTSIYPLYKDRLSRPEFLAVVYDTLGYPGSPRPGLFQTFDPDLYTGARPLADHFLTLFGRKLRGRAPLALARTDAGRPGDDRFPHRPELGLLRAEAGPDTRPALDLEVSLAALPGRAGVAVRLKFWGGLSDRGVGRALGVDHKTVGRAVDAALECLRELHGAEKKLSF